jgi:Na+/H+ antiporter NhaD/arsenite permease-like protein
MPDPRVAARLALGLLVAAAPGLALAAAPGTHAPALLGAPVEFFLFGAMLVGVAIFHRRTLEIALAGLAAILAYQGFVSGFPTGFGLGALGRHLLHEWVILTNLMLLLVGFELLSNQFEKSALPDHLPGLLPDDWTGGLALLGIVFVMSAFLDNIAAAVIGGVMARHVYKGRVSIGFLASIVACANAGGAGSVIGDTTTTIMWLNGISPLTVLPAYIASAVAFVVVGLGGAWSQQRYQPILEHDEPGHPLQWRRVWIVLFILLAAVATNITASTLTTGEETAPWLGLAVWAALLATAVIAKPDWSVARPALKGAVFLVSLVAAASLMPVNALPHPSWTSTLGLGFLSAVFDNIPLTALALEQGGYDWALLAYAVGFGGSMVWFGSSAGVALTTLYPEGRSVFAWLKQGWFVPVAYVAGFVAMLVAMGWNPGAAPPGPSSH